MDIPLSGNNIVDLMRDLGERANIIYDTDVDEDDGVEDIFQNSGHAILFHQWPDQNVGHWVCMIRNRDPGQVYYFDSFGQAPYNPQIARAVLDSYPSLLVNDISFQPKSSNACGRYCLLVCALNKLNLSPEEIEKFLTEIDVDDFVINTVK